MTAQETGRERQNITRYHYFPHHFSRLPYESALTNLFLS